MIAITYLFVLIISYLLGSLSCSVLLSKNLLGSDVREHGSGNAGATNMARVFGMVPGVLTLLGDMLKALVAMWIGKTLLGDNGLALSGIACMLGHCLPVFHNFKGGKGVSVGAAIALAIDWRVFLVLLLVFLAAVLLSKKVSVGSLCAASSILIACLLFRASTASLILAAFAMLVVIAQHRENIKRLRNGTEADFKAAKSE